MLAKIFKKENLVYFVAVAVFILFYYISVRTPLAGDDWGYALNGRQQPALEMAINFYYTWSGRFFSELYGFLVAPNKAIWNILNPLLFSGIFMLVYHIVQPKKITLSLLMILACMLSVDDNVRMETYTWIMGTTYVIPLFLSLLYFALIQSVWKKKQLTNIDKIKLIVINIPLVIIGLMMENIAATMLCGILMIVIYCFYSKKHLVKYLFVHLLCSLIAFVILRMSPGAAFRLARDSASFQELSLLGKVLSNFPNFIYTTFIQNNYMIILLAIVLVLIILQNVKNRVIQLFLIFVQLFAVISAFHFMHPSLILLSDTKLPAVQLFWIIYIISSIFVIWNLKHNKEEVLFFYLLAGLSAGSMLLSPIYGARSSLYSIYFILLVTLYLLNMIEIKLYLLLYIVLTLICADRVFEYYTKYRIVHDITVERNEIIRYYQTHPEDKEVWIPRYPVYSIHGADIEPGDDYHFETFKEYYQLPQQASDIHFYFKDSY